MGRKIEMKKIEDVTKCQVTFSKRRSSLMKKANEISVCCDVDVAFVAFSPSGRVSKYCNKTRIEDLLHLYVNLPPESRLNHLDNVQRKLEKLKNLQHIQSETSKLHYLDKQIENLELQIKKSGLELQIIEANLRDYELDPEQEPSLHLLTWCERNINHSLDRVLARKNSLFGDSQTSHVQPTFQNQNGISTSLNDNELNLGGRSFTAGQILTKDDSWIGPQYSVKLNESMVQDLVDQANMVATRDVSHSGIILETGTMITSSDAQIPHQQPLVVDHTLLNFSQQNAVTPWTTNNFSPATFSNAMYDPTLSLSTMPPPRSALPQLDTTQASAIYNFSQASMNYGNNFRNNYGNEQDPNKIGCNKMNSAIHQTDHATGSSSRDNGSWASKVQKSNLWEWEDLLVDENFNFGGFSK